MFRNRFPAVENDLSLSVDRFLSPCAFLLLHVATFHLLLALGQIEDVVDQGLPLVHVSPNESIFVTDLGSRLACSDDEKAEVERQQREALHLSSF